MSEEQTARTEAIQAVVDRVSAYQDGAPEGTVNAELTKGFDEAGVEVSADELDRLAQAIEAQDGDVDAGAVLG
ncbi:hypothetical protein [Aeromicrobium sp.]|uniref:hypothetical protein n=1 Tax=Aeromicrobium sp. TaxID=1871063 RepID=UPI0030BD7C3C